MLKISQCAGSHVIKETRIYIINFINAIKTLQTKTISFMVKKFIAHYKRYFNQIQIQKVVVMQ